MGLGWGFLKQMNDTMKYNRELLGKKKSLRDHYKDESKRRSPEYSGEVPHSVIERVELLLKVDKKRERTNKIVAYLLLALVLTGLGWAFFSLDLKFRKKGKYENTEKLFKTILNKLPNGTDLKVDYYHHGPKAAETYLFDGRKHMHSKSYYESGELFRSALYYDDSLVSEAYYFKAGDTIRNFHPLLDSKVHKFKISNNTVGKEIEFMFFDGKLIQGTYLEKIDSSSFLKTSNGKR